MLVDREVSIQTVHSSNVWAFYTLQGLKYVFLASRSLKFVEISSEVSFRGRMADQKTIPNGIKFLFGGLSGMGATLFVQVNWQA